MTSKRLVDVKRFFAVGFAIDGRMRVSSSSSSDEVESSLSDKVENLSVMGIILAYQDEPLANSVDGDTNVEQEEDADEDGLTSAMLLRCFEKTEPASTW